MTTLLLLTFAVGYLSIAFEHQIHLNKTAPALLTGVLCWTILAMNGNPAITQQLGHHLTGIAEILFFLLGAMTIVELVDAHDGFRVVTDRITIGNTRVLLWIVGALAFVLSALLDNLTASIVMISILRKVVKDDARRLPYAGLVVIAANAGGAWSPIGDVTTTMLWIGGQVTAVNIMKTLILPSLVCLLVPLLVMSFRIRPEPLRMEVPAEPLSGQSRLMFWLGVLGLTFVPVFKTLTHLPPYMGILLVLGVVWVASEIIHHEKDDEEKKPFTVAHALSRIDASSVLFFLGILLAIASLESVGVLQALAHYMDETIGNRDLIVMAIGAASAVVDNVPLVAATMGMYPLDRFPADDKIWEFIAYCAGTGGSMLIIGSAAGVAVMGMEKIDFMWYLRRMGWLALLGYVAGAITYLMTFHLFRPE